jgi:hypothetical protein
MSTQTTAPTQATQTSSTVTPEAALPLAKDQPSEDASVRPFEFHATDEELVDLKRRINLTRWPDRETVSDDSQGVQLATMQKLADYWANGYDWRKVEQRLNAFPNFITEIDGLDIHFIHVRSKHANALPIVITHGWPGSIIEQLKIIGPLADPTAHGGNAEDAFDVIIPSMPGYGFSARPTEASWGPPRIAQAWLTLVKRLGLGCTDDRNHGGHGTARTGGNPHQYALDGSARDLPGIAGRKRSAVGSVGGRASCL